MAIGATMYAFDVSLADVDRGVYEDVTLRIAQHPSETDAFMVTRLMAYCLEYEEGIDFASGGVSSTDEPAVFVRDLTGDMTAWIEIGAPDAQRLHHGSKFAGRAAVYTHRDPQRLLGSWAGKTIHRAEHIVLRAFDPRFVDSVVAKIARRNTLTVSATEGLLYVEINGVALSTEIHEFSLV